LKIAPPNIFKSNAFLQTVFVPDVATGFCFKKVRDVKDFLRYKNKEKIKCTPINYQHVDQIVETVANFAEKKTFYAPGSQPREK
jgi:hypothetical protein